VSLREDLIILLKLFELVRNQFTKQIVKLYDVRINLFYVCEASLSIKEISRITTIKGTKKKSTVQRVKKKKKVEESVDAVRIKLIM